MGPNYAAVGSFHIKFFFSAPAQVPRRDQILLNTPRHNLDLPPTPGRSWTGILEQPEPETQSQQCHQNNYLHHNQAKPVESNELVETRPHLAWNSNYLDPYTTNLGGESSGATTNGVTPTPFQTPPLSVGSSGSHGGGSVHSSEIDPERIQFNSLDDNSTSSMTPSPDDEEMPELLPIAPPDLFSDNYVQQADNNDNSGDKNTNLFPVPPVRSTSGSASRDEDCWSDAERSEWSDACWSDDETSGSVRYV